MSPYSDATQVSPVRKQSQYFVILTYGCLSPPSLKRFLHHAISAPVLCSGVPAPNCLRYEANAVKHISYSLAAMLAVAVLTPRQGCSQDATKLVPTEPAPARSAAPVKPTPLTVKQTYNAIYVAPLKIQKDVTFPSEYLAPMQTEISKELTSAKVFAEVVTAGQTASTPDALMLRLAGLITNYNPGNRAKRYFGAERFWRADFLEGIGRRGEGLRASGGEQGEADAEHARGRARADRGRNGRSGGVVTTCSPHGCHHAKRLARLANETGAGRGGRLPADGRNHQRHVDGGRVVPAHGRDGGSVPVQAAAHDTFLELAEGHQRAGRGGLSGFTRDARCPSG
jgi:hypothetical protein